ncbi:zinc finger MYM-type protein 1-like [Aphis gossypii]|uniref:TTF-type domain-containing protein n=1 Tax=Aphis gossypii TaxID=80765 RepID=A0A9P0NSR7_APHGO|nr:zinc finger MYM-type protein 1-like [Aphis gossypii]XP_050058254.1 zinc finger MYM-type protein 1-like [Aphis gossypii]CAH1722585.1 unnamed protein product [Aphis gossypii]CAH1737066.1 unnamed protein product [Aphis gossypii]
MKRRLTITDYFIKASYSTENNDDNNEDEEFPAPPGSKKNKDTPHTSQLYENNQVKDDKNDDEELPSPPGSKKNKDIPHISEVPERDPVKGKSIAFTLLSKGLGPYQPEMDKYPKVNGRKFCTQWYKSYKWLEYSPEKDAVFCFFCRAFDLSGRAEESFTINGFNKWSKASTCLPKHERSVPHKEAMVKLAGFKHSSVEGSITTKIDKHHNMIVLKNISYLKDILETLLFCARQGIGIRGHNEQDHSLLNNRGNFIELLHLRAKDNDIIKQYFIDKERRFRYIHPEFQNIFLSLMAKNVQHSLISNIKEAGIYSILVDETQDISRHEQVSICVRYVTESFEPTEVFLGFFKTNSTNAESLVALIKEVLKNNDLNVQNIRGQCYDGAASMRGSYTGVQARIKNENPHAIYVHCYAHILNLCLVDLTKQVKQIRNMFGVLNTLHNFIGASSKRFSIFESMRATCSDSKGPKTLKSLSDTRWNCRIEAIKAVFENLSALFHSLHKIANDDTFAGPEASSLLKSIETFDFIFCLNLLKFVFNETNILSKYLQTQSINYSSVRLMAQQTINTFKDSRTQDKFNSLWIETQDIVEKYDLEEAKLPRERKIPMKIGGGRSQQNSINIKDYYLINIFYVVLDIIIVDIEERFKENNLTLLNSMNDVLTSDLPDVASYNLLSNTYDINNSELQSEVNIFNRMFKQSQNDVKETALNCRISYILSNNIQVGFPLYVQILKLFLTLPTNTSTCERSFSTLKRIKTYLRSTTGQDRLNNLAILYVHRNQEVNKDEVIKEFDATENGRRMILH